MLRISDILWNEIKNAIPPKKTKVGRPPKDAQEVLSAIFFVMVTGIQWRYLPSEYGKPSTIHGIFRKWVKVGVFDDVLRLSIDAAIKSIESVECFFTDTSSSKAPFAKFGGENPTDRAKRGIKKSIVIDMNRIILSVIVDAANVHDSRLLLPHLKNIRNFVTQKPKVMVADAAYDANLLRKALAKENIALLSSSNRRRNKNKTRYKSGGRWRIEQIFGIQQWFRGIKFCWTKTHSSFLAFCQFASAIHNFRYVRIFV